MNCAGTVCQNCFPNYQLSSGGTICDPICTDIFCTNCVAPGICSACSNTNYDVVSGVCTLNCSKISIANCKSCTSQTVCTECNTGYSLSSNQDFCQLTCTDANCADCRTNQNVCTSCNVGYDLSSGSCVQSFLLYRLLRYLW